MIFKLLFIYLFKIDFEMLNILYVLQNVVWYVVYPAIAPFI